MLIPTSAGRFVAALTTGMRQGELLAPHWSDADLDAAALQVRGTLQRSRGGMTVGEAKTAYSCWRVALTSMAVEALRKHPKIIRSRSAIRPSASRWIFTATCQICSVRWWRQWKGKGSAGWG